MFFASDHGFTASTEIVRINAYLAEKGYVKFKPMPEGSQGANISKSYFAYLDWNETTAYCRTPSCNGITIRVARGPGETGMLAVGGPCPVGYHKDPEKTARTFRTVAGQRVSVPGDWARLEHDGTMTLLGRGSLCVNTGGEKVFPEEVEEALETHSAVRDSTVVGVPDQRLGEAVAAVVELRDGATASVEELIAHVKSCFSSTASAGPPTARPTTPAPASAYSTPSTPSSPEPRRARCLPPSSPPTATSPNRPTPMGRASTPSTATMPPA